MPAPALAKTLKDVFNTTNPIPLQSGDPRYVDCTKKCDNDDVYRDMLHNLIVLEYMNGLEPWHDVHPSVQRLAEFRSALSNG